MKALPDVLDQIASSAAMQEKLALLKAGGSVVFEHVAEAAQPFLGALLARHARARVWLVCRDVRRQEAFHNELLNWFPEALFFPEADLAPVEGALPDPETAAERLGIIQKLGAKKGREIVVLTAASLDDKVPAPATLKAMAIQLKRGTRVDREGLIAQLAEAGYEHVPQVAMRGQYAVRGGILDIFPFTTRCRCGSSFSTTRSSRSASSISMRRLPCSTWIRARCCSARSEKAAL